MATHDERRKRTWRYRLSEGAILEVSAPKGATEKQVRRRGRVSLVLGTLMAAAVLVGVAVADNAVADGDGVTPVGDNNLAFSDVSCGVSTNKAALVAIKRTGAYDPGTQVFKAGTTATVSVLSMSGTGLSAVMGSPATISIPTDWDEAANNDLTDYVSSTVTVNSSSPGVGSGTVTYRATGVNPSDNQIERDDTMSVSWTVLNNCASANNAPVVDSDTTDAGYSGDEGSAIALNRATASDTDGPGPLSYLWTIEGTPSVDGGTCTLNNATSLTTATITCTDNGTATVKLTATEAGAGGKSGSDTASVTINNANPAFDSGTPAFASAKVNCSANTVTLNFGFSDAGSNDTHTSTISWGDGSAVETFDETATALESASHTYNSGGPYTAVVNVTDDDAGSTGSTSSTNSLMVEYNTSGILQPVNDTRNGQQPSTFKFKSTIPVKIRITDCDGSVVSSLAPKVSFMKLSGNPPPDGSDEAASTVPPTDGNTMRWDAVAQQYIYNLATKQLGTDSSATYRIMVTIQPGQTVSADIGIKP